MTELEAPKACVTDMTVSKTQATSHYNGGKRHIRPSCSPYEAVYMKHHQTGMAELHCTVGNGSHTAQLKLIRSKCTRVAVMLTCDECARLEKVQLSCDSTIRMCKSHFAIPVWWLCFQLGVVIHKSAYKELRSASQHAWKLVHTGGVTHCSSAHRA